MTDEDYMRMALELAARGRGTTSPNPMVGAVVVADGAVVGSGYHRFAGGPHAEVYAIDAAGARARAGHPLRLARTLHPYRTHPALHPQDPGGRNPAGGRRYARPEPPRGRRGRGAAPGGGRGHARGVRGRGRGAERGLHHPHPHRPAVRDRQVRRHAGRAHRDPDHGFQVGDRRTRAGLRARAAATRWTPFWWGSGRWPRTTRC